MVGGLVGIAVGATVAGLSAGIVMFAVGLLLLALGKIVFDVGLISWTADHVPYERRGRVSGLHRDLVGPRAPRRRHIARARHRGDVVALGVRRRRRRRRSAPAGLVLARLDARGRGARPADVPRDGPVAGATAPERVGRRRRAVRPDGRRPVVFVTFGAWLEDVFGFGTAGLAAVTFGIGALELLASTTSAARTDRWGKERSVVAGHRWSWSRAASLLAALRRAARRRPRWRSASFIAAFEFSIVSTIPIGAELVPGAPGRGIGTMIACGTLGRAVTAIPATRLYDRFGLAPAALLGVGCAAIAGAAMLARLRLLRLESAPAC